LAVTFEAIFTTSTAERALKEPGRLGSVHWSETALCASSLLAKVETPAQPRRQPWPMTPLGRLLLGRVRVPLATKGEYNS
jgi:hypothetical protein